MSENYEKNAKLLQNRYQEAAVIAREAAEEMLSRLDWMTLKPHTILDISGLDDISAKLQARYPDAKIVKTNTSPIPNPSFENQSVDLIFANFFLPWQTDLSAILSEWKKCLRTDGLLICSALGPDTLREWREVIAPNNMPDLIDMHDLGDLLLQNGFADPVIDVNYYTTVYREQNKLIEELIVSEMIFSRDELIAEKISEIQPNQENTWPVTYEVVFAHAFAPARLSNFQNGEAKIALSELRQKLPSAS